MAATDKDSVKLTIMVFTGRPHDFIETRQVGIECYFVGQNYRTFFHSKGERTRYTVEERPHYNEERNLRFAKSIAVGQLQTQMTGSEVQTFMFGIQPNNIEGEQCQAWAARVLTTLADRNLLTASEVDTAIGGMVDAISEARDEDQAE